MTIRCLGKHPPVHDPRVPHFSAVSGDLPAPPLYSNWYADVPFWDMLGNDEAGDCVFAAALHWEQLQSWYKSPGNGLRPTTAEAIRSYSSLTGFDRNNPATDQGTVVLGPSGLVHFWATEGLICGGEKRILQAAMQVPATDPMRWKQAINTFGGMMIGFSCPEAIAEAETLPTLWDNPAGKSAGGHEVLAVGYEVTPTNVYYDLISWGTKIRATEKFLLALMDEATVGFDRASLDARGYASNGLNEEQLIADMDIVRGAA
jgi:hypothetical protein